MTKVGAYKVGLFNFMGELLKLKGELQDREVKMWVVFVSGYDVRRGYHPSEEMPEGGGGQYYIPFKLNPLLDCVYIPPVDTQTD